MHMIHVNAYRYVNAYIIRIDADSIYAKSYAIHNAVYIEYNCIYHTCRICNISSHTIHVSRVNIIIYITSKCICNTYECLCLHVIVC